MKNKQDMTNLAMELFFAQIDFELYKLYDCDCDDNAERKLKELRQKFYHDSLEYFLNNEAFKKIFEKIIVKGYLEIINNNGITEYHVYGKEIVN